ncbi:MAG: hypothetical protein V3U44_03040, partial [Alphaproteobacteria bacterium]
DGKGRPLDDPQITFEGILDLESEGEIAQDAQAALRETSPASRLMSGATTRPWSKRSASRCAGISSRPWARSR